MPDNTKWSPSGRHGYSRLHSLPAQEFWWARKTLTQRAIGPESTVTTELDASGMKPGDVAGLALLNRPSKTDRSRLRAPAFGRAHSATSTPKRLCSATASVDRNSRGQRASRRMTGTEIQKHGFKSTPLRSRRRVVAWRRSAAGPISSGNFLEEGHEPAPSAGPTLQNKESI